MKKALILIAAAIILVPSLAYCDLITFRLGYYSPKYLDDVRVGGNSLWDYELTQLNLAKQDFRGGVFGFSYEHFLTPKLSVAASIDIFNKRNGGYYQDYSGVEYAGGYYAFPYPGFEGDVIYQNFQVSMVPIQFSLKFYPIGRKASIVPFVGGGGGPYFIHAAVSGSLIDFNDGYAYDENTTVYGVYGVTAAETYIALGGHAFGGIMIPIGYRLTLEAEARYHFAKADFHKAFTGYDKFDMSGLSISIGLNYWF